LNFFADFFADFFLALFFTAMNSPDLVVRFVQVEAPRNARVLLRKRAAVRCVPSWRRPLRCGVGRAP
jgi:hypothetical protein